ncbi:MAG: hypothetical protein CM15mP111_3990 [Hyphomicrobiales bacterium]|nr:MAG: hypothetical protein CM15mP111_3990 [Hyphomicrobiales bacterium]
MIVRCYISEVDVTVDLKSIFKAQSIEIEDSVEYIARGKRFFLIKAGGV